MFLPPSELCALLMLRLSVSRSNVYRWRYLFDHEFRFTLVFVVARYVCAFPLWGWCPLRAGYLLLRALSH